MSLETKFHENEHRTEKSTEILSLPTFSLKIQALCYHFITIVVTKVKEELRWQFMNVTDVYNSLIQNTKLGDLKCLSSNLCTIQSVYSITTQSFVFVSPAQMVN